MFTISLEQLRFHSPIGFYPEERSLGNDFLIDVHIKLEEGNREITDLSDTIDYVQLYQIIKKEMSHESALIETVAQKCISSIQKEWPNKIKGMELIIQKLHPQISGDVGSSKITFSKNF
ncbi:MAG TPA: dihydroneopterin aldolase [Chitinophagaceae bacterium]|nr:dihydroneopterin aldolase [Chitinophagaceae bacterium]